jgi:hypothetical protein
MLNPDPVDEESLRRPAQNSPFLIVLIVAAAIIVALQYTDWALFSADKTSTLWGVLTGLVIGGFIFRWLKVPFR